MAFTGVLAGGVVLAPSTGRATTPQENLDILTDQTPSYQFVAIDLLSDLVDRIDHALRYRTANIQYRQGIGGFPGYNAGDAGRMQRGERFVEGMAAGGAFPDDVTVWTSGSFSSSEDDFPGTAFDSDTASVSFGGDIKIEDWVTAGVFVSLSDTDSDTPVNFGGADTKGVSFGPYISGTLNDNMYVDMSAGVSLSDVDNRRIAPGTTLVITGDHFSRAVFGSANLNGSYWMGNIGLSGRVGLTGSSSRSDDYIDSTGAAIPGTRTGQGQVQLEAQAAYYISGFLPFLKVTYNLDVLRHDLVTAPGTLQPANDNDEVVLSGGVNVFALGPVTASASFSKTFAREDFDSWTASGNLSFKFGGK